MEIQILTLGDNTDRFTQALHDRLRRDFGPGIGNVNVVVEPQVQTYVHHQDSAHGWIEVPMHVLRDLGIAEHISAWSYRDGDLAYLERGRRCVTLPRDHAGTRYSGQVNRATPHLLTCQ